MSSLPKALAERTLSRIRDRFGLEEVHGEGGGPRMTLKSAMSPAPVGAVRLLRGKAVPRLVFASLTVPQIGLDSHMLFAFTAKGSAVPHFTLDAVSTGQFYAFHLDLIPRADLGAHLAYMNATLQPLTPVYAEAQTIDGLTPAMLTPRQRALMSPWMMANRATAEAFQKIEAPVNAYLDHWFGLVERGVPADVTDGLTAADFAARDRRNRAALFNPETDPVWVQVDRLLGAEASGAIRELLKEQDEQDENGGAR